MTPIQKYVTPYIIQGNDVMGCSQTGSGKTIAFLLPIVEKMLSEGPPDDSSNYYNIFIFLNLFRFKKRNIRSCSLNINPN